jgi:tight adherence protein B
MSAGALAFGAAAAGVFAAWDALGAAADARLGSRLRRVADPLRRAGTDGREPAGAERRRLGALGAISMLGAGWLLAGPVAAVALASLGPALVLGAARWRAGRYAAGLEGQAPAVARALADAVAAGHAVRGALGVAAPGLDGAAGRELRAGAQALAFGERTEDVLERLRRRARSPAWDTLVAALLLQRDAGGDLVGLLRRLAGSLEAAERARRDARTATAQARCSGWLVAGMPFAAATLAELASPGFLAGLVAHPISAPLLAAAAVLQVAGLLAIRRVAR